RTYFFFQAEDGIRDATVTGVQTCALPIYEDQVGAAQSFEHTRGGTRRDRTLEAHPVDLVAMSARDEPFLERKAAGRRVEPRAQRSEERRVGKEWGAGLWERQ